MSEEELRKSEVAERQAGIELRRLEASRANAQAATKRGTRRPGPRDWRSCQKDQAEARRVLDLATPRADRAGVVTWTLTEEGATIRRGRRHRAPRRPELVPRRRLGVGRVRQPARARASPCRSASTTRMLDGQIADVLPTVQNGVITVRVALEDRSNPLLRPNLRVEVFIVTGHRDRALRVRKGSSTSGEGVQQVFVVRGDRAERVARALRHRQLRFRRGRRRPRRRRRGDRLRHGRLPAPDVHPSPLRDPRHEHDDPPRRRRQGLPHGSHRDRGAERHQPGRRSRASSCR